MKSELTKLIERKLVKFDPDVLSSVQINKARPRHTVFEAPVIKGSGSEGLVDALRIFEFWSNQRTEQTCMLASIMEESPYGVPEGCMMGLDEGDTPPDLCMAPVASCVWQKRRFSGIPSMCLVCMEIKISVDDFHSFHGHNFYGNLNFYVMPENIYESCATEIPEGVGAIVLQDDILSEARKSEYKSIIPEYQKWMLLSALKAQKKQRVKTTV